MFTITVQLTVHGTTTGSERLVYKEVASYAWLNNGTRLCLYTDTGAIRAEVRPGANVTVFIAAARAALDAGEGDHVR